MQFYGLGELGFGTLPMFAKVQGIYRENHYNIQENPDEGFPAICNYYTNFGILSSVHLKLHSVSALDNVPKK